MCIRDRYKTHWSGSFKRAGKQRRGGYYFHIESGNSFVAGGFFGPSPQDLQLIRENIAFDAEPLRELLKDQTFITSFQYLKGEQLKTTPKGFDAAHKDIDLLRYKQFLLVHHFADEEVLKIDFANGCNEIFKNMRPFLDYMIEVLTTDTVSYTHLDVYKRQLPCPSSTHNRCKRHRFPSK